MSARALRALAAPVAATALLALTPADPGVVLVMEVTEHTGGPQLDRMEMMISGERLAVPVAGPGGMNMTVIFRGDMGETGALLTIDHANRTYFVMDEATVAGVADQMGAAMAQMEAMLESLPPEQREAFEKMRAQGGMPGMPGATPAEPPSIDVRDTGETDTVNGFAVRKHEIFVDGIKRREMWTTPWSRIEGGDEVRAAFEAMGAFGNALLEKMPRMPGQDSGADMAIMEATAELGVPVLSREYGDDGALLRESTLHSVERRDLDDSVFEPPAGYRKSDPTGG